MNLLQSFSTLALLLSLAHAVVLPQQHEVHLARDLDTEVKVFLSSRTRLEDLAKELKIDSQCLKAANPSLWLLNRGESCIVPQACCGTSCRGSFCSKRPQCYGQSTSTAPVQTGSSTTCYSTITTSVASTILSSQSVTLPGYGSSTYPNDTSTITVDESTSSNTAPPSSDSSSVISTSIIPSPSIPLTSISPSQSDDPVSTTSQADQPPSSSTGSLSQGNSSNAITTTNSVGDSSSDSTLSTTGAVTFQTTDSDGSTIVVTNIPAGSSTSSPLSIVTTPNSVGETVTSTIPLPSSSIVVTTNSLGETVTSTVQPASSTISSDVVTTTNSAGDTVTSAIQPPLSSDQSPSSLITTTNSAGETFTSVVQPSLPPSSDVTTTNSAGETITSTSQPSLSFITTTNSAGETLTSAVQPSSSTLITTTNSDGETVTSAVQPSGFITTTNPAGETVTSDVQPSSSSSSILTLTNPDGSGITVTQSSLSSSSLTPTATAITQTTTDSAGSVITTVSSVPASSSSSTTTGDAVTTTNSDGSVTIITPGSSAVSVSSSTDGTSLSDGIPTVTDVDSSPTTIALSSTSSSSSTGVSVSMITNTDGPTHTGVSSSREPTPPTSDTTTTTTTPDSSTADVTSPATTPTSPTITSPPSSSSTSTDVIGGVIFPVTTPVPEPKGTDEGSVIPCNIWFFNICINWLDINISGWLFDLPEGIRPPGPPPPITFPPSLSITTNIIGNLPDWPTITIGPDNVPTPEPEPEDCETESAELCMTRTSFGVSSTLTTDTQVLSTCATIYGCKVSDSATTTSTTSTCSTCSTCYSWPYDEGFDIGEADADSGDAAVLNERTIVNPFVQNLVQRSSTDPHTRTGMMPREVAAATTSPATTNPPLNHLRKRVQPEGRVSTVFGGCTLRATMTMEDYPAISDLPNFPAASSYFVISKRSIDADGTCHAGRIYSTSDIAGVSAAVGEPAYATGAPWPHPTPGVNMDHVYENSLLGAFFAYALALPDAPSCEQFNSYFVDTGRLQGLFQRLANINNPDFAAMDKFINTLKANFFHVQGGLPNVGVGRYPQALNHLQGYAMVASFLNMPEIISLFRSTHQRIYQAFGEWDQDFGLCNQAGLSDTWAATYSGWMTSFLASRADFMTSSAAAWYQTLADGGAAAPVYTQLQNTYPVAAFSVSVDALASGLTPAATQGVVPRQAACTLSAPQTSEASSISSVAPPTDLPTLTGTVAISTPSGSSCALTTTFEQCNGSGDQAACVTASSCDSWEATDVPTTTDIPTTTSTTPTSTTYEAPLYTSDVVCNNEADYPGHADISGSAQENLAEDFCNSHNTNMYPGPPGPPLSETLQDSDDINYYYGISWKDQDCRPEGTDSQNTYQPQGSSGITCPILMVAAYKGCNNGGVGGYIDVGCLRYRFDGGI